MLFLSGSAFSRKFQKATGQSFSAYTTHLKTIHAAELLRNTDRTVTEIAEESGFNSSAVMQRHFRRVYACSPMEYRKKQNGQKNETIVSTEKLKEILDVITEEGEKEWWTTANLLFDKVEIDGVEVSIADLDNAQGM